MPDTEAARDILLISGLDFTSAEGAVYQIGQGILHRIVSERYRTEMINFDSLHSLGILPHGKTIRESLERMTDYMLSFSPRLVGFYTICNSFLTVLELAQRLHEKNPAIRIVFGGPHASVTADACLRSFPFLAAVCRGESEKTFLPLAEALLEGGKLEEVPGITYLREGSIVENPSAPLLTDEELGRYTVFQRQPDEKGEIRDIALEGGRGCPFSCTFCSTSSFWERHFRVKPVDTMIAEMDRFHELYHTTHFSIEHDNFTCQRSHISEFCRKLIERGSPYRWRCSSRTDVLDGELISMMAEAGCTNIFLGVETGSPRMQKILRKNLKLEDVCQRVSEIQKAKILATISLIYGLPEETLEDLRQTIALTEKLYLAGACDVQLHRFFPLPRTEETEKVRERMYFDDEDVDLSIYNRTVIDKEGLALIRAYPELFTQYYTFHSEPRDSFPYLESVFLLLCTAGKRFYRTCCGLIRTYGIEKIYFMQEEFFRQVYISYSKMFARLGFQRMMDQLLGELLERIGNPILDELFRFESDTIRFMKGSEPGPQISPYRLDLISAMRRGVYREGESSVCMWRDAEGKVRSQVIPSGVMQIGHAEENPGS